MNETASAPSPPKPTVFHVALALPWIALVINAFTSIIDNSFLWHIRAGALQLTAGEVMTSDVFSFTVFGTEWRTQSWLVELGYGWLEGVSELGFTGPMVLVASLLAFVSIGAIAYRHSRSVAATAIVVLLAAVILPRFMAPRPVLFSYLLFPLVILAWERRTSRWMVPFVFWVWAGVHGGFVIGLAYVGLRIIQERDWKATSAGLVSGAGCLLTAHGLGVVTMLLEFFGARQYLAFIQEWQTPNFLQPTLLPMIISVLLIVYGAARGRVKVNDLWIIGPFLVLALSSQRSVGVAWVALAAVVSRALGPIEFRWVRGLSRPAVIVAMVGVLLLPFAFVEPVTLDEERFPLEAAGELRNVNTFHGDAVGGYLIWRHGPEFGVFVDDRVELYRERIEELVAVRTLQKDWRPVFDRDGIEQALLGVDEPLVGDLAAQGWIVRHEDEGFVVMSES